MKVRKRVLMLMLAITLAAGLPFADPGCNAFAASKKPEKVILQSVTSADYNAAKITWKKANRAKKYEVYRATSKNGKYKLVKTTANTSFTSKALTTGKKYYFKVRAINGSQKGTFSIKKAVTPKLKQVKISKVTAKSSTVSLTYKKVNGAKKYQIYQATSKKGKYKLVGTTSKLTFTDKGLTAEKNYYYKIRAMRSVNGKNKYGSYSVTEPVKTEPKVIRGKENWLFYNPGGADGDPIADLKGKNLLTEKELSAMVKQLVAANKKLKAQGIDFVVFIAPNKESFYGNEYLPDEYKAKKNYTTADQVTDYIRKHSNVKVVYAKEALQEVKEKYPQWDLYFETDTHWNSLGAYIGTKALMKELGIAMEDVSEENVVYAGQTAGGDMVAMFNPPTPIYENNSYAVKMNGNAKVTVKANDFKGEFRFKSTSQNHQKFFMIRDSFCTYMAEYIASNYRDSVMMHSSYYKPSMIKKEKPDVVVYEIVERYVRKLSDFTVEDK